MTSRGDGIAQSLANAARYSSVLALLSLVFGCSSSDSGNGTGPGGAGGAGGDGTMGGAEPILPDAPATCPDLKTGNITVRPEAVFG